MELHEFCIFTVASLTLCQNRRKPYRAASRRRAVEEVGHRRWQGCGMDVHEQLVRAPRMADEELRLGLSEQRHGEERMHGAGNIWRKRPSVEGALGRRSVHGVLDLARRRRGECRTRPQSRIHHSFGEKRASAATSSSFMAATAPGPRAPPTPDPAPP